MSTIELLTKWEAFIGKVEQGYSLTIYDYTNELTLRGLLLQASTATTPLSTAESNRLKELDQRFRIATQEAERPITPGFAGGRWWYYRIPLKRCGELLDDLREEGHL